jgi:hypothetical protein
VRGWRGVHAPKMLVCEDQPCLTSSHSQIRPI